MSETLSGGNRRYILIFINIVCPRHFKGTGPIRNVGGIKCQAISIK